MAFKSTLTPNIGTAATTVHTGAVGVDTTLIGLSLANIHTNTIRCDITITKSGGATTAFLIKGVLIPQNDAFVAIGAEQKLVLQPGDYIQVVSDVASSVDVTLSYLES